MRQIAGAFLSVLLLAACAFSVPVQDIKPEATPRAQPQFVLPAGYHADADVVFVLMTAPLQITPAVDDRAALAAIAAEFPGRRVCVIGADSQSIEHDSTGAPWLAVLGYFCMPPATGKTTSTR